MTILSVQDVTADYGAIRALHGVSLHMDEGEVVAILGPNGAGKSSLLRAISGLLRVSGGCIEYRGRDATDSRPHHLVDRGMCHVPEGRRIFGPLTVMENLQLGAYRRSGSRDVVSDFERMFQLFPALGDRSRQRASTLSGGEQQMLAIARALMGRPDLLLLDEPSQGLAPQIVRGIFARLTQLNDGGLSILLIEQNARAALTLASRAYVLEVGTVVATGSAAELEKDERVRELYFGSASGDRQPS